MDLLSAICSATSLTFKFIARLTFFYGDVNCVTEMKSDKHKDGYSKTFRLKVYQCSIN